MAQNLSLGYDEHPLPEEGRLAGIDFGTVRIGLATCDPSQTWVTPFDTYLRRSEKLDASYFVQLSQREHLVGLVLGLPIHCDGKESQKSGEVREFGKWLHGLTALPVAYFDERFSTAEARRLLNASGLSPEKKKKNVDRLAAHLILTHFLESRRNAGVLSQQLDDSPPE